MAHQVLEPEIVERQRPRAISPDLDLLARWMDSAFEMPGLRFRFGWDALLGLIPGLGDTVTTLVSLYILGAARRYGVPRATMVRMAANIAVDYLFGAVPLLGDMFDVYWKANQRNVALLRRHVDATPAERRRAQSGDWLFVAGLVVLLVATLVGSVVIAWWIAAALWHLLAAAFTR